MMTRVFYLVPFYYFWNTRLRRGSLIFHFLFEWVAAVVLVCALADGGIREAMQMAGVAYLAFISLYEIGYIANDLIVAPGEKDGRRRGPQLAGKGWIALWIASRVALFATVTIGFGKECSSYWWAYYGALATLFVCHNAIRDKELKAGTFLWLSWFRFMAPVVFAVPLDQVLGIGLACAMSYSAFRELAYLDSKSLLSMRGRKRAIFRWTFFLWPLLGLMSLGSLPGSQGFGVLTIYFASIASLGVIAEWVLRRMQGLRG